MTTINLCKTSDLVKGSGVCALLQKGSEQHQVALFYLPDTEQKVFGLSNWDPIGEANVMSRGILGSLSTDAGEALVVASPLYKQHFDLTTGQCLEEEDKSLISYQVSIAGDDVVITV